jgi:competence protein ComEC
LIAPFLHARKILRIDSMVLSHPQLDHYGGLAYLAEHFAPREFWWNGMRTDAAGFARLERALERAGTQRVVLRRGAPPIVRGDVVIDVLHPGVAPLGDLNNGSLVVRLRYGSLAVLFSGDIEHEAEREIAASLAGVADGPTMPAASTVLKVPHHGSATSSTATLLAAVRPRVAVISAGADNRFGFPARTVLERLSAVGAMVWRTDLDGAIRVESDGDRLTVDAPCGRRDARTIDLKSPYPFDSS